MNTYEKLGEALNVKLTDDYRGAVSLEIGTWNTADGYEVWVATSGDGRNICINEDVYYYDSDLGDALEEQIKYSNGVKDYPEVIYVDDLYQSFIDHAIENLFIYLSEKFEEEVINELIEEGYEEQD